MVEVGMWVRTEDGITKITNSDFINQDTNQVTLKFENDFGYGYVRHKVIKASHNIIDVIEVGDYVNGEKVCAITTDQEDIKHLHLMFKRNMRGGIDCYQGEIDYVVTKEQFNSIKTEVSQ